MMKRIPAKRAPGYLAPRYGDDGGRIDTAEFATAGCWDGAMTTGYTGAYSAGDAGRMHAQMREITQPMKVQPKKRLIRKIGNVFG
jgi:hypothetical protein